MLFRSAPPFAEPQSTTVRLFGPDPSFPPSESQVAFVHAPAGHTLPGAGGQADPASTPFALAPAPSFAPVRVRRGRFVANALSYGHPSVVAPAAADPGADWVGVRGEAVRFEHADQRWAHTRLRYMRL